MSVQPIPQPRAKRLLPEERRASLLEASIRAFSRGGIASTCHADVAREAGTSRPTVFHYFPTREALREAVTGEVEKMLADLTENAVESGVPAVETLRRIARSFDRAVKESPDLARIWLDWSTAIDDSLWARYVAFHDWATQLISTAIERGQSSGEIRRDLFPTDASRIFLAGAYAVMQMRVSGLPDTEVDRVLDGLVTMFRSSDRD
jgi:TetR/AcrR family hemagglutinin/protease transcriptional regulator